MSEPVSEPSPERHWEKAGLGRKRKSDPVSNTVAIVMLLGMLALCGWAMLSRSAAPIHLIASLSQLCLMVILIRQQRQSGKPFGRAFKWILGIWTVLLIGTLSYTVVSLAINGA